ncbi:glycosyltransferase family 2 protein [Inmirania thermothiophila]|uniref:Glycosyltransferase involved in cell wall biosynthesis n=1 Tax=Inmirania thermothiophila TaxID=1750597 RepID=A0A3N1XSU2_9GAMM|nr:glycosyltransferase family 2 protein [Inmirania thermothiophila]ROR29709.1 glycosyltransferase involved in cell wall biosynthesis [Inmirania thermothiophila]
MSETTLTVVLPARNEAAAIGKVVRRVRETLGDGAEILVVDDGSTDGTAAVAEAAGARVIRHPYGMGNGAAIKTGARAARGEVLVFMDADGQHDPADIPRLLTKLDEGYAMAVGARSARSQASLGRWAANGFYNRLASYMVGHRVADLTSGFRAVRAERFREFLHLLPNGFSYPTTITMAFFRAGYPVAYVPIEAAARVGRSHIRPLRDGARFLLIIFRVGTLYAPLKLFAPLAALLYVLGLGYYAYTFAAMGRFTNMSALLLTTATVIFLIGLVSEQITQLMYTARGTEAGHDNHPIPQEWRGREPAGERHDHPSGSDHEAV